MDEIRDGRRSSDKLINDTHFNDLFQLLRDVKRDLVTRLDEISRRQDEISKRQSEQEAILKTHMNNEEEAYDKITSKLAILDHLEIAFPKTSDGKIDVVRHATDHQEQAEAREENKELVQEGKKKLIGFLLEKLLPIISSGILAYIALHVSTH